MVKDTSWNQSTCRHVEHTQTPHRNRERQSCRASFYLWSQTVLQKSPSAAFTNSYGCEQHLKSASLLLMLRLNLMTLEFRKHLTMVAMNKKLRPKDKDIVKAAEVLVLS